MGKRKEDDTLPRKKKKIGEQQNSAAIMISVAGQETVFPVKLNRLNKH